MVSRGGDRGGRRPLKTAGDPRLSFTCRLRESNLAWLQSEKERTGKSAGELVDFAVGVLRGSSDIQLSDAKTLAD